VAKQTSDKKRKTYHLVLDSDTVDKVRRQAERERRSLSMQIEVLLCKALGREANVTT